MLTMSCGAPDPKTVKRKALLLIKARKETDDDDAADFFPTGIENEVIFMEITGKLLHNLYSTCQVSPHSFLQLRQLWLSTNATLIGRFEFEMRKALNFGG